MSINEAIKIINDARSQRKLVIFVGAGVSMNSGLPGWSKLIEIFASALSIKKSKFSQDDYLKIPQYYFNEHKEKSYYQVIKNLFDKTYFANPIHKLIFDLKPAHIITTNFDNLIEKASIENGTSFDVVKQDSDLPYAQKINNIIKMHGDLELRNIVLKEDDYLSYSLKFPLIETFVKSLIATKTILFIGYRVYDPDVKLIFQWVKDLLGESYNRSFYLDTSNLDTEFEKESISEEIIKKYYDNRGIHLLHFNELEKNSKIAIEEIKKEYIEELEQLRPEEGKKLFIFIRFIIDKKNEFFETVSEKFYTKILPYKKVRAIRKESLKDILELKSGGDFTTKGKVFLFYQNDEIYKFIKEAKEIKAKEKQNNNLNGEIERINDILSFFNKTGALGIQAGTRDKGDEFIDLENIDHKCYISNEIILFDFKKIHSRLNLKQAYD